MSTESARKEFVEIFVCEKENGSLDRVLELVEESDIVQKGSGPDSDTQRYNFATNAHQFSGLELFG